MWHLFGVLIVKPKPEAGGDFHYKVLFLSVIRRAVDDTHLMEHAVRSHASRVYREQNIRRATRIVDGAKHFLNGPDLETVLRFTGLLRYVSPGYFRKKMDEPEIEENGDQLMVLINGNHHG